MAKINSMEELAHYCLRSLGGGVNDIEVTEEQMKDRLTEALEFFIDRHFDGSDEIWLAYQVTEIDMNRGFITLPYNIKCVIDVAKVDPQLFSAYGLSIPGIGVIQPNMSTSDMAARGDFGFGNMAGYYISRSYIELINDLMNPIPYSNYNSASGALRLPGSTMYTGQSVMVHAFQAIDVDDSPDVYNDRWLKKYATALIKRQWGANLKKYVGIKLPGDISIDGQVIYDEAMTEIAALETEFEDRYEYMSAMMVG